MKIFQDFSPYNVL